MIALINEDMAIAPGVVETIVALAVNELEGVTAIGKPPTHLMRAVLGSNNTQGIDIRLDENDALLVDIHIFVRYGEPMIQIAERVRKAALDAITTQVGLRVASVDVYIDGLQFGD